MSIIHKKGEKGTVEEEGRHRNVSFEGSLSQWKYASLARNISFYIMSISAASRRKRAEMSVLR
jgi:hypothetical protein